MITMITIMLCWIWWSIKLCIWLQLCIIIAIPSIQIIRWYDYNSENFSKLYYKITMMSWISKHKPCHNNHHITNKNLMKYRNRTHTMSKGNSNNANKHKPYFLFLLFKQRINSRLNRIYHHYTTIIARTTMASSLCILFRYLSLGKERIMTMMNIYIIDCATMLLVPLSTNIKSILLRLSTFTPKN